MSSTTTTALTNVVVGILPTADAIPFFIAIDKGYFAQQGLNISVRFMAGGAVIAPAVAQGSLQIGESATLALMAGREQGFDFKFIAPMSAIVYPPNSQHTSFVPGTSISMMAALTSSGIRSWKDLGGKTVGVNTVGSISHAQLLQSLKDNGVDTSSVHVVAVPPPDGLAALQQHRVDAYNFIEPFVAQLRIANGTGATSGAFRIIGDPGTLAGQYLFAGFFSTSSWINSNPAIVTRFVAALNNGIRDTNANETLARQMMVKYLHTDAPVAKLVDLYTFPASPISYQSVQFQIQLGLTWGMLKNQTDSAAQLVDSRYLQLTNSPP